jgi:iron(III) transport system substrate-binding protein
MKLDSFAFENLKGRLKDRWNDEATRRRWLLSGSTAAIALSIVGMVIYTFTAPDRSARAIDTSRDVVLYTSADDEVVRAVTAEFNKNTGIKVKVVSDTEATKSTGLVQRIIDEHAEARAAVWWSSELVGTMRLATEGVLEPLSPRSDRDFPSGWPRELRATDRAWHGFAQRARVLAYNTNRLTVESAPKTLRELTAVTWINRVGMPRPQFGTMRTQIAALLAENPRQDVKDFLIGLRNNKVRFYDGNSAVVRALSQGEIDVGLTDTDDVWAAQREKWPVACAFETQDDPKDEIKGLKSLGPHMIPNTAGKVRGGPHPQEAIKLLDFLLSSDCERILAFSESKNIPVRENLRDEFSKLSETQPAFKRLDIPTPWQPDSAKLAAAEQAALALIDEVFGKQ